MSNFDLSNLTPEQEQPIRAMFRFIRRQAALIRAQQKAAAASTDSEAHEATTASNAEPTSELDKSESTPILPQAQA
ncbi:MAG: hypothetical protein HS114_10875 [Anaerolineales bacterium]|nr:hypothetical protein [Anaerolineales bacterium]